MIKNKTTHFLSFEGSKSTAQDVYANDVTFNTRLIDRPTTNDPYAQSVVFNMRCDGEAGSYYHYDDCGNSVSNRAGTVPPLSTTVTRDSRSVLDFSTNAWIQFPHSQDFQFGYDNFTIEFWAMLTSFTATSQSILHLRTNDGFGPWVINYNQTAGKMCFFLSNSGVSAWAATLTTDFAPTLGTWFHAAVVRNGNTITFYIDGVSRGSVTFTDSVAYSTSHAQYHCLTIGASSSNTEYLSGYLQDIRITKGIARYTSTFTPPSQIPAVTPVGAPLITDDVNGACWTNSEVTYQSTGGPFNGPCMYFNGASYIETPSSSSFDIFDGTSEATLELWFKTDKAAAPDGGGNRTMVLLSNQGTSLAANNWNFLISGNSSATGILGINLEFYDISSIAVNKTVLPVKPRIAPGTWNHLAITRENAFGPIKIYLNGKQEDTSQSQIGNLLRQVAGNPIRFGMSQLTSYNRYFIGWMTDIRVTRKCRYFGNFTPSTTGIVSGEEFAYDTSLLMHFNDYGKTPEFCRTIDFKNHTITATGTPLSQAASPFNQGASLFFNGTSDYLTYTYDSRFDLSTGDFTIEYWIKPGSVTSNQVHVSLRNPTSFNGIWIGQYTPNQNKIVAWVGDSNTSGWEVAIAGTTVLKIGVWYHVAFVRSANLFSLFVNGVLQGSTTWAGSIYINSANVLIGSTPSSDYLNGSIDDLRITKGVARYSDPMTAPSAPLPFGPADPQWANVSLFSNFDPTDYFVDSSAWHPFTSKGYAVLSSDQSKFGAKSAYFGGTGVITTPHKDDLHLPGDFTIEGWIYPTVTNVDQWILTKAEAFGGSYPPYTIKMLSAGTIQFLAYSADNSGNGIVSATFGTPTGNAWNHFAVVRFKDKWYGYLNGVGTLLATTATNPYNNTTNGLAIGGDWIGYQGRGFTGYIDEVRIIKGVAKYWADFSVPTKEFDFTGFGDSIGMAYPGFHCHFNGTSFVDERGAAITANGNAVISTTQSKFGGTSGYFDGTGDYIEMPNSSVFDIGSGDFTIECWIYPTAGPQLWAGAYWAVIIAKDSSSGLAYRSFWLRMGGVDGTAYGYLQLALTPDGTNFENITKSFSFSLNTWYHIAAVRKGSTYELFVNGNSIGTGTASLSAQTSTSTIRIGRDGWGYGDFTGYIDEFRFTKGFARYTKSFTPASIPFAHSSGDPHWDQVVWALPLIGPNGSTTFYDKGPFFASLTNSNVIYAATDIRRFGSTQGTAASFNGTSARLTIPASNGRPFNAQSDWTVEGWFYSTASGNRTRYSLHGRRNRHLLRSLFRQDIDE